MTPNPAPIDDGDMTLDASCSLATARRMTAQAWPLERLASSFERFTSAFAALPGWVDPDPLTAMVARTLLIHEYRRIVLYAPALPAAVVPPAWPAETARQLCAASYAALQPASEAWLDAQHLPPAMGLDQRFTERVTDLS